jgi:hypothetical protein
VIANGTAQQASANFNISGNGLVAGNLGVGTASPSNFLDVASSGVAPVPRGITSSLYFSGIPAALFFGRKARGTEATPTAVANGDFLAAFQPQPYDGSTFQRVGAIGFAVNGSVGAGVVPTDIYFFTTSTVGDGIERMRITSAGDVGIGTANPSALFQVGSATCNGTTWSNASSRDYRRTFDRSMIRSPFWKK